VEVGPHKLVGHLSLPCVASATGVGRSHGPTWMSRQHPPNVGWKVDKALYDFNGLRGLPPSLTLHRVYSGGYDIVARMFFDYMHLGSNVIGKHMPDLYKGKKMIDPTPCPTLAQVEKAGLPDQPLAPLKVRAPVIPYTLILFAIIDRCL
jgi:hypothetical protein